jgi:predicted DNA-binding antitoxin AbrB/MazE fold protein
MSEQIAALRADRDAFGHMLLDQLNGDSEGRAPGAAEIIERDDGFVAAGDCRRYFAEYAEWNPVEQEAMPWLAPGRALDLGCGAGRVAPGTAGCRRNGWSIYFWSEATVLAQLIDAVYERGNFKPLEPAKLPEGQRVTLSVEPMALTPEEAEAQLRAWHTVYEGLSDADIAEVEAMALDRSHFFRDRDNRGDITH